jgi:hypothetical protein
MRRDEDMGYTTAPTSAGLSAQIAGQCRLCRTSRRAERHNNASRVVNANLLREDFKVFREPRPSNRAPPYQSRLTNHFSLAVGARAALISD